jgi:hypothetical protein
MQVHKNGICEIGVRLGTKHVSDRMMEIERRFWQAYWQYRAELYRFCGRCGRAPHRGKCVGASKNSTLRADQGIESVRLSMRRRCA